MMEERKPSIDCNESYLREYAPFDIVENKIIIHRTFYNDIESSEFHKSLQSMFEKIIIQDSCVRLSESVTHHDYMRVCNAYLDWYSADKWCHVLPDCVFVSISKQEITDILQGHYTQDLLSRIDEGIHNNACFVKFKCKSTKHEYSPIPVHDATEALDHLLQSKQLRRLLVEGHPQVMTF